MPTAERESENGSVEKALSQQYIFFSCKKQTGDTFVNMDETNDLTLGFVGEYEPAYLTNTYFPNKIGGKPAWLELSNFPPKEVYDCKKCAKPLAFLCQIYAPQLEDYNYHRMIYVFICRTPECQEPNNADNMLVLRSQLPLKNDFYPVVAADYMEPPQPEIPTKKPVCIVCGCPAPFQCGSCKKLSYCSKQHQNLNWTSHKPVCKGMTAGVDATSSAAMNSVVFPELDIVMETVVRETKSKRATDVGDNDEDEILAAFKKLELEGETGTLTEESEEVLEEYCNSKIDKSFKHFKKVISEYQDQIIRYDCGNAPLWIADVKGTVEDQLKAIPACASCGSQREFEFQIMPQTLLHLKDDKLDWGVLAIYTCKASCPITGYVQEHAIRQDVTD